MAITIRISGAIESWSASEVIRQIEDAAGQDIQILLNSEGGAVFAAHEIFNALLAYPGKTTCTIIGLAASSASYIALACQELKMYDYALIMWHLPFFAGVEEKDLNDKDRKALKSVADSLVTIYQKRLGWDRSKVETLVKAETWFDSSMALKEGIVNEVIETELKNELFPLVSGLAAKGDALKNLRAQLEKFNKPSNKMKELIALLNNSFGFSIPLNSTEGDVAEHMRKALAKAQDEKKDLTAQITSLTDEKATLEKQVTAEKDKAHTAQVDATLDKAVEEKKITAVEKDAYAKLAATADGLAAVTEILKGKKAYKSVSDQLKEAKKDQAEDGDEDLAAEFDKLRRENKLEKLKNSNLEKFKELFKAKYNREYNG